MNPIRRSGWVAGLLLGAWLLVVGWQVQEHHSVVEAAKSDLRDRSHDIANTVSAVIRAARFRGTVVQDRIEPVLELLVKGRTNALVKASDLIFVTLLNTNDDPVVSVGNTNLFSRELLAQNEFWSSNYASFVLPVEGASLTNNNTTVVLPSPRDFTNGNQGEFPPRHEPPPDDFNPSNGPGLSPPNFPPPPTNASAQPALGPRRPWPRRAAGRAPAMPTRMRTGPRSSPTAQYGR